jgi:hypothetical protein
LKAQLLDSSEDSTHHFVDCDALTLSVFCRHAGNNCLGRRPIVDGKAGDYLWENVSKPSSAVRTELSIQQMPEMRLLLLQAERRMGSLVTYREHFGCVFPLLWTFYMA